MSASIVFDRHPSYHSLWGMLQYSSTCRDGASGSDMTAVTLLQGAPLHLVIGATWLHTFPPSSTICSLPPLLAWLDAGMPCPDPREKV